MAIKNADYIVNDVIRGSGFPDRIGDPLKQALLTADQKGESSLKFPFSDIKEGNTVVSNLAFKRGTKNPDVWFYDGFKESVKIAPHNFVKDLTSNNQSELKFTYNEAYQMITNGWVYKRGLHNKEGEAYNTWAGAIINEHNQTEIKTYHDKYGYKQEDSMKALPVVNYRPEDTLKVFDKDEKMYKDVPLTIDLAYGEMEKGKSVPLRVMFVEEVDNKPVGREILVSANAYPPARSHNLYAEGVSVGMDLTENFKQYIAKHPELYQDLLYPLASAVQEKKDNNVGVTNKQQVSAGQKQSSGAVTDGTSSEKKSDATAEMQKPGKAEKAGKPVKNTGPKRKRNSI
ncbi:hypothetical protein [Chitinophaga sancti]|uniref:Uncharacterized protein n=1 Tax=Chitinophaga sancti TaxID=1004 RepID=A0A1K1SZW2_9BACT|nr:hypothetical protein [Chitinophaga sancti]WQD65363.1 hypothetical protein U0033_13260 [Chitinophaga sancti]WQG89013.1 hypothetical protein SR876_29210 [Chitinophaga sancti]SFW89866.1 hypothetical protein SAMN05661012_06515 [Chitinophaga sancti]